MVTLAAHASPSLNLVPIVACEAGVRPPCPMLCQHHLLDVSTLPPDDRAPLPQQPRACDTVCQLQVKVAWCQTLLVKLQPSRDQTLLHYLLRHSSTWTWGLRNSRPLSVCTRHRILRLRNDHSGVSDEPRGKLLMCTQNTLESSPKASRFWLFSC